MRKESADAATRLFCEVLIAARAMHARATNQAGAMLRSTTSRRYRFQPYSNASIPALVTRHETFAIFTLVFILRTIIVAIAVIGVFIPVVLFGSEVLVLPVVLLALDHSIAETRLESWAGPPIARTVILLVSLAARVWRATEVPLEAAFAAIIAIVITRRISLTVSVPVQFLTAHVRVIAAHGAVIVPALHIEINLRAAIFTSVLEAVQVSIAEAVRVCALWALIVVLVRHSHSTQGSRHNAREAQPDKLFEHFFASFLQTFTVSNRPPAQVHLRAEPDE